MASPAARLRSRRAFTCPSGCWPARTAGGDTYCECDYAVSPVISPYTPTTALADAASDAAAAQAAVDTAKGYIEQGVTIAMVYHGYRRTGSILWALLYGLAGKEIPTVALPIALAQGFGQRKPCPAP